MLSTNASRRATRAPIIFSRPSPGGPSVPASRTKSAIAFLCLFDGLRTPSIRRLVRKPATICERPLLTFDPSFYAPSSEKALRDAYAKAINCVVEITIDPSVQTVLTLLRRHATSMPPQRVLLHYFGHGVHAPEDDGCVFFFSDDRSKYKRLKISNIVNACSCPLCIVLDCPRAGVLAQPLQAKRDLFAFFACASDEFLPLSTDAPMDLFSSCLLNPFDTALWWHMRRHSSIYETGEMPIESNRIFLSQFLDAVLEGILFDSQTNSVCELFHKDPSMASLARGFALSQRVMLSFNIHPSAQPELKPMGNHQLWSLWDIALDFATSLYNPGAAESVLEIVLKTFVKCPSPAFMPIFGYFLRLPDFHDRAADELLEYLDTVDCACDMAAKSLIPRVIVELDKPSEKALVILAKLMATEHTLPCDVQTAIAFTSSKDVNVLKAGMMSLCCAIATSPGANFSRLTQICIDHATECAPYSALLLGLLNERAGRLMNLPAFGHSFVPLLDSEREDIRASTAFLLGVTRDPTVVEPLLKALNDPSSIVREQVVLAVINLMKITREKKILDDILALENDPDPRIQACVKANEETIEMIISGKGDFGGGKGQPPDQLLHMLVHSVKQHGFRLRYKTSCFSSNT